MKLFNFKKKDDARKMTDIYADLFAECNSLATDSFKLAGVDITDLASDLDEETGALIGRYMESMRRMTDLAAEQAAVIDRMESKLDALQRENQLIIGMLNKKSKKDE